MRSRRGTNLEMTPIFSRAPVQTPQTTSSQNLPLEAPTVFRWNIVQHDQRKCKWWKIGVSINYKQCLLREGACCPPLDFAISRFVVWYFLTLIFLDQLELIMKFPAVLRHSRQKSSRKTLQSKLQGHYIYICMYIYILP